MVLFLPTGSIRLFVYLLEFMSSTDLTHSLHALLYSLYDTVDKSPFKWKNVEVKKKLLVHEIVKIDDFNKLGCAIVRFRSSLQGPCIGMKMVEFIMDFNERSKWDPQIESLQEVYPAADVDAANIFMNFQYGDCKMLGIGYTRTKRYLVIDGREQLTLCGLQEFANGACVIWGTEMQERHDNLFPSGHRHVRAKTHLFSIALMPTGPDSFDVEYILQLEAGGNLPNFLTLPVLVDSVKAMFSQAKKQFADEEIMAPWLPKSQDELKDDIIHERYGLLMTP